MTVFEFFPAGGRLIPYDIPARPRVEILSIPRDKVTHMPPMDVDVCDGAWRKARRSVNNGACVEVASTHATVLVRDSVNPAGLTIKYAAQTWQSFIADTKGGAFDVVR